MDSFWDRLAEQSKTYAVADFERAAYRLVTAQVLSVNDTATRKDFYLVSTYLREYKRALEPLGISIRHNTEYRYVVAQPRHVLNQNKVNKAVTLMVLTLASLYHQVRFNGLQGDFGEAIIELPALQESYQGLTGEDLPGRGEVRAIMEEVSRWGIASLAGNELDTSQPFSIRIHPAITEVVTEAWLSELEQLYSADRAGSELDEGDNEDAGEASSNEEEGADVPA